MTTETYTAAELAIAEGPDGPEKTAMRRSITMRAQAWVERIDKNMKQCCAIWATFGVPENSIVGIRYYHPKYSPSAGDSETDKWPAWVKVSTHFGDFDDIDPDGSWLPEGKDVGGQAWPAVNVVAITKTENAIRTQVKVVHEVGHCTKDAFERQEFGPDADHSTDEGLMDPEGTKPSFSNDETDILRGIVPDED